MSASLYRSKVVIAVAIALEGLGTISSMHLFNLNKVGTIEAVKKVKVTTFSLALRRLLISRNFPPHLALLSSSTPSDGHTSH